MSKKAKKDDETELDTTANAPDETGIVTADEAEADGAGQPDEAKAADAASSDEVATDATAEREMPGAADADTHAVGGEKPETETPENRVGINVLAAYAAASIAFGTTNDDSTTLPRMDLGWLTSGEKHQEAAECAAEFARRTIAAPPETLVIHLRRSGFPDTPEATGRTEAAWRIFLSVLAELDRLDRAQGDEAQRAELIAQAKDGPRAVSRADLTMAPADPNPLTDLGRRLQHG